MSLIKQKKIIGKSPIEPPVQPNVFGFTVKNDSDKDYNNINLLNPCRNLGKENYGLPKDVSIIGNIKDIDYSEILYDLLIRSYSIRSIDFSATKREWLPKIFELNYRNIFNVKYDNKFVVTDFEIKNIKIKLFKTAIFKNSKNVNIVTHRQMSLIINIKAKSELFILFEIKTASEKKVNAKR